MCAFFLFFFFWGGGGGGVGAAPSAGEHCACVLLQNVGAGAGSGTRPVSRLGILCTGLVWIPTTASYSCPTRGGGGGGEMAASIDAPTQEEVDQLEVSPLV